MKVRNKYRSFLIYFLTFFVLSIPGKEYQHINNSTSLTLSPSELRNSAHKSRKISFSGYNWTVRTTGNEKEGPGPNYFNNSMENVWLDNKGRLHLKIIKEGGKWYCAEIYSDKSFGHGSYNFQLAEGFEDIDKNVVLGLFTYLDDEHEIDVEFARWGQESAPNAQYAVQPHANWGNLHRYEMSDPNGDSVHGFTWCENYIKFWSALGSDFDYDSENLIEEWYYTGNDNPEPDEERVHINLWLMDGLDSSDNKEVEVIIKKFKFTPSDCNDPIPFPLWSIILFLIIIVSLTAIVIIFFRRWKIRKKTHD